MTAVEYIAQIIPTGERGMKKHEPELKPFWIDQLLMTAIHVQGIKPKYKNLRLYTDYESENLTKVWITPTGWQKKYQKYFECNILNRYPTMREERFHWQCSVYPNFAQSLFLQAIDELRGAIFQDGQYEFSSTNEATAAYIEGENFDGLDFDDWISTVLMPLIIQDPNGCFVVFPANVGTPEAEAMPVLKYVSSEKVKYCDKDLFVFEQDKDLYLIDKDYFFKLTWNVKTQRYSSDATILHNFTESVTVSKLGGYYMATQDGGYYVSYFAGAVEWANIAIRQFLDNEAHAKDLIPIVQQVENECPDCNGSGKIPVPCDDDGLTGCTSQCTTCKGKGTINRNIGDVITLSREYMPENGNLPELLKYITPDVSILEHSEKRFEGLYDKFRESLYLKFTQEAQSGVAKALDREKMYKFLLQFSDNLFDLAERMLVHLDTMITGVRNVEAIGVKSPSQFQLKTDADLRKELIELTTANAPVSAIKAVSDTLVMISNESSITERKTDVLSLYDPLRYVTNAQKERLLSVSMTITKADYIKSLRCDNELDRLIHDKGAMWFIQATFEQVAAELDARIMPYIEEVSIPPLMA